MSDQHDSDLLVAVGGPQTTHQRLVVDIMRGPARTVSTGLIMRGNASSALRYYVMPSLFDARAAVTERRRSSAEQHDALRSSPLRYTGAVAADIAHRADHRPPLRGTVPPIV